MRVGALAPTIIVYGFADAVAALAAAAGLATPVRLKCPFIVAASLGPRVARSMLTQASAAVPNAVADWVLDCGEEPGLALAALQAGVPEVQVALRCELYDRLADIAAQLGLRISNDATGSLVLDLADNADSAAACREWLKSIREGPDCRRMLDCQC